MIRESYIMIRKVLFKKFFQKTKGNSPLKLFPKEFKG
jgi:hypothetical protein